MPTNACLLYLHALSPLHMGSGRADGTIDLPHAREAHTGYPVAPGSGIKGVLRDELGGEPDRDLLFGRDAVPNGTTQGALTFSDGALLCLPVRSMFGTFAWVTSPYLLDRYNRDRLAVGLAPLPGLARCFPATIDRCTVVNATELRQGQGRVILQDLDFVVGNEGGDSLAGPAGALAAALFPGQDNAAWQPAFVSRLVVVQDAAMAYFTDFAMEVRPRVRLEDETKTVKQGQLWYEESLPTESLLFAVVAADAAPSAEAPEPGLLSGPQVLAKFRGHHPRFERAQFGGKATVGRGIVRTVIEARP